MTYIKTEIREKNKYQRRKNGIKYDYRKVHKRADENTVAYAVCMEENAVTQNYCNCKSKIHYLHIVHFSHILSKHSGTHINKAHDAHLYVFVIFRCKTSVYRQKNNQCRWNKPEYYFHYQWYCRHTDSP